MDDRWWEPGFLLLKWESIDIKKMYGYRRIALLVLRGFARVLVYNSSLFTSTVLQFFCVFMVTKVGYFG